MYSSAAIAIPPLKSGTKPEHNQERYMKRVSRSERAAADIDQEAPWSVVYVERVESIRCQ